VESSVIGVDGAVTILPVDASIKLWLALTTPQTFRHYQAVFQSIFR